MSRAFRSFSRLSFRPLVHPLAALLTLFMAVSGLVFTKEVSWAGTDVGNGGDALLCGINAEATRIWFLDDYLAQAEPVWNPLADVPEISEQVRGVIARWGAQTRDPDFKRFSAEFLRAYPSGLKQIQSGEPDLDGAYVWQADTLPEVADEALGVLLPPECRRPDGSARLQQLVVHHRDGPRQLYSFDAASMEHLIERPRSVSMIVVHEFLWNHASSARVVRETNAFLHSHEAANMSEDEARLVFISLGISLWRVDL